MAKHIALLLLVFAFSAGTLVASPRSRYHRQQRHAPAPIEHRHVTHHHHHHRHPDAVVYHESNTVANVVAGSIVSGVLVHEIINHIEHKKTDKNANLQAAVERQAANKNQPQGQQKEVKTDVKVVRN